MSLAKTVSAFCQTHRLRLNTDLGQHFLVDEAVLQSIVEASGLTPEETAVEIGPGIGILTKELLGRAKRVVAIELDGRLLPLLAMYTSNGGNVHPGLEVINANALAVPFPDEPYRIVANIPYHITSPLLRHAFLESPRPPISLTLLIQREVAERICDDEDRGLLTILVSLFGKPRLVRHVPPGCFLPPPKVDSAVLHVDCFPVPLVDGTELKRLLSLTKIAFGQKRKMLGNTLGHIEGGKDALAAAGIDPTRRPQTLAIEEWVRLARAMS